MYEVSETQTGEHANAAWSGERVGDREWVGDHTQLLAVSARCQAGGAGTHRVSRSGSAGHPLDADRQLGAQCLGELTLRRRSVRSKHIIWRLCRKLQVY